MTGGFDLGSKLESVVDDLVGAGRYGSRDAVLREGVRLLAEREKHLDELDAALARGIADVEAGRLKAIDEVTARLVARFETMSIDRPS